MTSPSSQDGFIREWVGADGETWYAFHPLHAATREHHQALAGRDLSIAEMSRLVREYATDERHIPDSVQERAREIDALQP